MAETAFLFIFLLIGLLTFLIEASQYISEKLTIPQVLGEILLGIVLGPTVLYLISFADPLDSIFYVSGIVSAGEMEFSTQILAFVSEMAGLLLLLEVGVEMDFDLIKKLGKNSASVAIGGIIVPLISGIIFAFMFTDVVKTTEYSILDTALFLGVALTATSIGISIRVLIDLDRFESRTTGILIGAAIIDDILALVLFSLALGFVEEEQAFGTGTIIDMGIILLKILLFVLIVLSVHYLIKRWVAEVLIKTKDTYKRLSFVMGLVFVFAWLAGSLALSPIIGAFVAGVLITQNSELKEMVEELIAPLSKWLIPFFFVSVGFRIDLKVVSSPEIMMLSFALAVVAILSKLIGAGLGALANGNTRSEALELGLEMSPRGEVILVIATAGLSIGVFSATLVAMIVMTVVITATAIPIALKTALTRIPTPEDKSEMLKL